MCENFRAVIIQRAKNYFLTIKYCFNHSYIYFSKPTKNAFTNSPKNRFKKVLILYIIFKKQDRS
ncbi:hypothetical protein EWZ91_07600 [Helicobacter pylori]|nr:hypothetical protein [Helicobacter pylori]PUD04827.1 hypothetical protein C2R91_00555 [Helicobacter pylori]QEF33865.1 hypothetical protein D2C79_04590 [Helicobacter pylori]RKV07749.1 hypothetical protein DDP47_05115 [Helicobacter pylori]RVZ10984.1 hypothetical protein EC525_03860 [Helicobacter pylori]